MKNYSRKIIEFDKKRDNRIVKIPFIFEIWKWLDRGATRFSTETQWGIPDVNRASDGETERERHGEKDMKLL